MSFDIWCLDLVSLVFLASWRWLIRAILNQNEFFLPSNTGYICSFDTPETVNTFALLSMYACISSSISHAPASPSSSPHSKIARSYVDKPASSRMIVIPLGLVFLLSRLQLREKEHPSLTSHIALYTSVHAFNTRKQERPPLFSLHPAPAGPRSVRPFFIRSQHRAAAALSCRDSRDKCS